MISAWAKRGSAVAALLLVATSVQAVIEEIVVTAQKRDQVVTDIPMSISAFAGDDLERLGIDDTRGIAAIVPGFTYAQSRSGPPVFYIRGVGFNTELTSGTSPVGLYIDEFAYPYPVLAGQAMAFDIERVEVLKGPQGTLYGRNTTGGLVNFITRKPTDAMEGYIRGKYGRFDSFDLEGALSGPISDTVRGRISFLSQQSDGWQESISRGDAHGDTDRVAVRGILEFDFSPNFTGSYSLTWQEDQSDSILYQATFIEPQGDAANLVPGLVGSPSIDLGQDDARAADWGPVSPIPWGGTTFTEGPLDFVKDQQLTAHTLRLDLDINENLTLTSLTNYAEYEQDDTTDGDGTPYELLHQRIFSDIESFGQEVRLTGEYDSFNFVVGAYFGKDEVEERQQTWAASNSILRNFRGIAAFLFGPQSEVAHGFRNWENYADVDSDTWSVFGQADFSLSDHATLTAGLRYTEDSADLNEACSRDIDADGNIHALWNVFLSPVPVPNGGCITLFPDFSAAIIDPFSDSLDEDSLSGRLAINWDATDATSLYASVSRGFKSGNFFNGSANVTSQFAPVVQEELWAYEVGAKSKLGATAQLNVSLYYYDYEDKQIQGRILDPIFGSLSALVNAPEAEVMGAEADLTWFPTDNFVTRLAIAYNDNEFKEYEGFDFFGNTRDFDGAEFLFTPSWQIHWLATYSFAVAEGMNLEATVDVGHNSSQQGFFESDPRFNIDSYTLIGANIALVPDAGNWEIAAFGRNLTDKYYRAATHYLTDTGYAIAGRPRTYGLSLTYRFGAN